MNSPDLLRSGGARWRHQLFPSLLIGVLAVIIACSVLSSAVTYVQGDSRGTLLLSQTMVQLGTVKLDSQRDFVGDFEHQVRERAGHLYYYFPLGSSLYSAPFVAAANLLGQDMRYRYDENRMQVVLAALLAVTTFLLLFFIARALLGNTLRSALLAALFWFGSGYCSTAATALWSHDWAAVTSLLAILLVIRAETAARQPRYVLIGFFLFSAYLCRPTLALLSPVLILFLFTVNRPAAVKVAAVVFALLALFSLWSLHEFGQPLPDYYLPKRLGSSRFADGMLGNLFSPSRGLFVYMPYLLVPLLWWRRSASVIGANRRVLILLAWPVIHLVSVSSFGHWWGGYSFGPRLMLDAVPAFFVYYCLFVRDLPASSWAARWILATGLLAVYMHWYQGLFNVYAYQWNVQPGVDKFPATIGDWHYPQFLHSEARHNQREREFQLNRSMPPIAPGEPLGIDSESLAFVGWHAPWPAVRWSRGETAEIYFRVKAGDIYRGELRLHAGFYGRQGVTVFLNDRELAVFEGSGETPVEQVASFEPALLRRDGLNVLRFRFSSAGEPARGQHFHLAMALQDLTLD